MLSGEKLRFKSRKGQWRKRVIAQVELMVANQDSSFQDSYTKLELAVKLRRMGILGEKHLADAKSLDFSDQMLHDIRMVLFVIASFSFTFRAKVAPVAVVHIPVDREISGAKDYYAEWTVATRKTWQDLMETIGRMK